MPPCTYFGHCGRMDSPNPPSSGNAGSSNLGSVANTATPAGRVVGGLRVPTAIGITRYLPGLLLAAVLPIVIILVVFSVTPTFVGGSPTQLLIGESLFVAFWLVVIFPLYLSRQVRRIEASNHPQVAWMEALIVLGMLFLAIFAHIYRVLGGYDGDSFTQPMDLLNSYYYALTVFSTLGLGDITPVSANAKIFTMAQIVCDLTIIGLVVKVLSSAATTHRKHA